MTLLTTLAELHTELSCVRRILTFFFRLRSLRPTPATLFRLDTTFSKGPCVIGATTRSLARQSDLQRPAYPLLPLLSLFRFTAACPFLAKRSSFFPPTLKILWPPRLLHRPFRAPFTSLQSSKHPHRQPASSASQQASALSRPGPASKPDGGVPRTTGSDREALHSELREVNN